MILVPNLATTFQDLVAKVKNLVALAPVLGAISRLAYGYKVINQLYDFKGGFTTFGQLLGTVNIVLTVKGHFLDATRAAT